MFPDDCVSGFLWADISPDEAMLAVAYWEGTLHTSQIPSDRQITHFKDPKSYNAARFSPDGNTLIANSLAGVVHFWHAPSWAEIEAAEKGPVSP